MKPVNSKSLLAFVFDQMEKLDSKEIDTAQAGAQSKLIPQANTIIKNEIDRTRVKIQLERHNKEFGSSLVMREIESKNFE